MASKFKSARAEKGRTELQVCKCGVVNLTQCVHGYVFRCIRNCDMSLQTALTANYT